MDLMQRMAMQSIDNALFASHSTPDPSTHYSSSSSSSTDSSVSPSSASASDETRTESATTEPTIIDETSQFETASITSQSSAEDLNGTKWRGKNAVERITKGARTHYYERKLVRMARREEKLRYKAQKHAPVISGTGVPDKQGSKRQRTGEAKAVKRLRIISCLEAIMLIPRKRTKKMRESTKKHSRHPVYFRKASGRQQPSSEFVGHVVRTTPQGSGDIFADGFGSTTSRSPTILVRRDVDHLAQQNVGEAWTRGHVTVVETPLSALETRLGEVEEQIDHLQLELQHKKEMKELLQRHRKERKRLEGEREKLVKEQQQQQEGTKVSGGVGHLYHPFTYFGWGGDKKKGNGNNEVLDQVIGDLEVRGDGSSDDEDVRTPRKRATTSVRKVGGRGAEVMGKIEEVRSEDMGIEEARGAAGGDAIGGNTTGGEI
ncbi:hypothetical protein EJ06DRAFT_531473 [Trichodelitschia bisporula]|uniref:Uncharacterized protein n=1 Tax=Trichodelitschia bisporula TaxID=703511 RepID=A0A6G1HT23_9PEZI|nr:hypothetical protein EJ06DRAFT_531473 [Trichodelitschia bisporula]